MRNFKGIPCLFCLLAFSSGAISAPEHTINWSFDGFGTFGWVYSDESNADFVGSLFAQSGAGHSRRLSPEVDSKLGVQLTAGLTPSLTAVVQVVSEQNYDGTYKPRLEWANLKYDISPEFDVRVGRMVLPSFLVSEHRKVGYANPWVRPPQEVYRLVPVTNFDGIDFSRRFHLDDLTATVRGGYGVSDVDFQGGEAKSRDGISLMTTLESRAWTVFARYNRSDLTIEAFDPLFDGFRQFGPAGEAIADRYGVDNARFDIWSLGWQYDPGDWFLMAEWSRARTRSVLGDSDGWYVTSGYRHDRFTPYATLAGTRPLRPTSDPGLATVGLPPELAPQAMMLNSILNEILGLAPRQRSLSLGIRWDAVSNIAVKLQYDYIDLGRDSPGVLMNLQPDFKPGGSVSLLSLSVDFLF